MEGSMSRSATAAQATAYDPIRIIDLEPGRTTWSRVHADMRTVYLRISRAPERQWLRFFQEERASRIGLRRHGLWIEEHHIVFDCLLSEIERYHLPDLHQSIDVANRRMREHLAEHHAAARRTHAEARTERETLAALRALVRAEAGLPPLVEEPKAPAGTAVAAPVAPKAAAKRAAAPVARRESAPVARSASTREQDTQAELEARRAVLRAKFRSALRKRGQAPA